MLEVLSQIEWANEFTLYFWDILSFKYTNGGINNINYV